jgi:hydroxymethylglutaryl-CoA synthase
MEHVYDFYKPDLSSEFPEVDGPLTIACFFRALDHCYGRYLGRLEKKECISGAGLANFDYLCLHSPYTKLVQKSLGRLAFNDFLRNGTGADLEHLQAFKVAP